MQAETLQVRRHYEKRSLFAYALRRAKWALGDRSPMLAYLKVTKRCNFDCYYCPWHTSPTDFSGELPTDAWKEHIDGLVEKGIRIFVFEGGEPTLRSDLQQLLDHAHAAGASTILATNGSGNMWRFQPSAFTVSVDGPEELHDAVRGKGSFAGIMRNLEKKGKERVVTITVISPENKDHLEDMARQMAPLVNGFLFTFQYPYQTVPTRALSPVEVSATKQHILAMKGRYTILNPRAHLSGPTGAWASRLARCLGESRGADRRRLFRTACRAEGLLEVRARLLPGPLLISRLQHGGLVQPKPIASAAHLIQRPSRLGAKDARSAA